MLNWISRPTSEGTRRQGVEGSPPAPTPCTVRVSCTELTPANIIRDATRTSGHYPDMIRVEIGPGSGNWSLETSGMEGQPGACAVSRRSFRWTQVLAELKTRLAATVGSGTSRL